MNFSKQIFLSIAALIIISLSGFSQHHEVIFSENLIKAIASKNIDEIVKLKPSPDIWRVLLEKETKNMTDEEINEKANMNEKVKQDFENIMYSAKTEKIDLSKIKYKKAKVEKIWEDSKMPLSITIKYDYMGKEGEFALSVFKFEDKYYLSEILTSYDVFSNLK